MKKSNLYMVISILAIVVVVSLLGFAGIFGTNNVSRNSTFNPHKANRATKLFEEVISADLENDYPKTVEQVLDIYLKTVELIYSNMIFDNDVLRQVVQQQRKMFTANLLESNPEEEQFSNLLDSIEQLNKQNITLVNNNVRLIEQRNGVFVAEIVQNYTKVGTVNMTIFFEKNLNDDSWKIANWQIV